MAAELRRALAARGMSGKALGDAIGMSHSTVYDILRNDRVPTVQTAALMADALGWPNLVNIARRDRTKTCEVCGTSFVDAGRNGVARCCGPTCQGTRYQRRVRGSIVADNLRGRAEVAENRLDLHRRAVAAFCAGCEPESFCRDAECSLRPVSPLPLADRRLRVA